MNNEQKQSAIYVQAQENKRLVNQIDKVRNDISSFNDV